MNCPVVGGLSVVMGLALMGSPPSEVPSPSPPTDGLRWEAAAPCPDAAQGRRWMERFSGGPLRAGTAVRVALQPAEGGYDAVVDVDGSSRRLHATDCRTLARAAALVVAVSIDAVEAVEAVEAVMPERPWDSGDPSLSAPPREPTPNALDPVPGVPEPTRVDRQPLRTGPRNSAADARRPAPQSSKDAAHWLGVAAGVARARLPTATAALRGSYAFERGAVRLRIDGHYDPPRRLEYPDEPGIGARLQSAALGARGCFAPAGPRWSVPLCVGLEGGPIIGRGFGIARERVGIDGWVAGIVGLSTLVRLHPRVALTLGADAALALRRPAFHVGSRAALLRSPTLGVRGGLGVEFRLK